MNILVTIVTLGAFVIGVVAWRSGWILLRRLLAASGLLIGAYLIAWAGAGAGLLPRSWVTDHPIAVVGAWSLAVVVAVGSLTLSKYRTEGRAQSVPQA